MPYNAIDLFAGCGGMTQGLKDAGFSVLAAVEIDKNAAEAYRLNHEDTYLFENDIRLLSVLHMYEVLNGKPLHLLVGCPPCQGFSSIRRRNKKEAAPDERNSLVVEYLRFVKALKPLTIMLENVPGIVDYTLFHDVLSEMKNLGYSLTQAIVNVAKYGVPQRRKRYVMLGSRVGRICIPDGTNSVVTVKDIIGDMDDVETTEDQLHRIYPKHTPRIQEMIEKIPPNGGSREDLPEKYILECHKKDGIGFHDVYGRLKWNDVSSTITGGCLKPSKGRFLHPEKNRNITAREAALLQTFPRDFRFPTDIPKDSIALMIGNALPPEFSRIQCESIIKRLDDYYA